MSHRPDSELELPAMILEPVEDLTPAQPSGFLRLIRRRYVVRYPDGSVSEPFVYDEVDRKALDAVVIVAHYRAGSERFVYLRSAFRPPIVMRAELGKQRGMWELPAGLIEPEEASGEGPRRSAARELEEEIGFNVALERLCPLGPVMLPLPAAIAECHHYFEVEVDPSERREPSLDGSALERFGAVRDVPLTRALELCASGAIDDAKTELALRRLAERFA